MLIDAGGRLEAEDWGDRGEAARELSLTTSAQFKQAVCAPRDF